MRYFVSAVQFPLLTEACEYEGMDVSLDAAWRFLRGGDMISLLWHPEPAVTRAISEVFGVATTDCCPYLELRPGDEVLVVHFNPPGDFSLPEDRQKLFSPGWLSNHCKFRLITKLA
jgi:hypothetical protein